ncbi:hypothetical protein C1X25_36785, partial [Pseudomonas sp. GW247-3R2A]
FQVMSITHMHLGSKVGASLFFKGPQPYIPLQTVQIGEFVPVFIHRGARCIEHVRFEIRVSSFPPVDNEILQGLEVIESA